MLTCFNTPFGRFKWLRMPFGLNSAAEVWQRRMHEIVEGLPGTEVMFDDFLIIGMLSRAYLEGKPSVCTLQLQVVEPTDQLSVSPERLEVIKSATASDTVLQSLCEVVKHGWPHELFMSKPELYLYFHIRDEITVQNGLLFKANRVLVPTSLRKDILQRIH